MSCSRCPHYIKHGQFNKETNNIHFHQLCALKIKKAQDTEYSIHKKKSFSKPKPKETASKQLLICEYYPFSKLFNHLSCPVYQTTFNINKDQNNVIPTSKTAYNENIESVSVTDMELL